MPYALRRETPWQKTPTYNGLTYSTDATSQKWAS